MSRALRRRYGHASGLGPAVRAMRVYLGSVDFAAVRDQQRLYTKASRAVAAVADKHQLSCAEVWQQIEQEARRQGIIRPVPGQHL